VSPPNNAISQFLLFLLLRNKGKGPLMKLIQRIKYMNRLMSVVGTPDIKVITGIRRSGKSKLMDMFMDRVKKENRKANIIHVNFNDPKSEPLAEYHALYDYVQKKHKQDVPNLVFIDEVQMCKGFEKAINGLHATEKFDIYITGSNAFLLSSDLSTLFTGRTFAIEMFPFSFAEFMQYYGLTDIQGALDRYLKDGGMAGSYVYKDSTDKYKYIKDVFDTLVLRDIVKKYNIRNKALLERLCDFLSDNISNITSLRSISDTLSNSKTPVNDKTIGSYVGYLCNAFAFYKVRKYDIRGKKYLASQDKYYLGDQSFKYARLGTKNMDYGRAYENIVAIELLRRGYEIYAGFLYKKEIDFVALKKDEKIYIQVSDDISAESTFEREVSPLLKIKDAYPKMILARTRHEPYQYEGIRIVDLAEWLSDCSN
jgi:predicted AAA+ superfamily ATPase